jgi:hypothetical protein
MPSRSVLLSLVRRAAFVRLSGMVGERVAREMMGGISDTDSDAVYRLIYLDYGDWDAVFAEAQAAESRMAEGAR